KRHFKLSSRAKSRDDGALISLQSLPRSLPQSDLPADQLRPVRVLRSANEFSVPFRSSAKGRGLSRRVAARFHRPVSSPPATLPAAAYVSPANFAVPADTSSGTLSARSMVFRFPS